MTMFEQARHCSFGLTKTFELYACARGNNSQKEKKLPLSKEGRLSNKKGRPASKEGTTAQPIGSDTQGWMNNPQACGNVTKSWGNAPQAGGNNLQATGTPHKQERATCKQAGATPQAKGEQQLNRARNAFFVKANGMHTPPLLTNASCGPYVLVWF